MLTVNLPLPAFVVNHYQSPSSDFCSPHLPLPPKLKSEEKTLSENVLHNTPGNTFTKYLKIFNTGYWADD